MAGFKKHCGVGILLSGVIIGFLFITGIYRPSWISIIIMLGLSTLASLFPDIDTDSKSRGFFYGGILLIDLILFLKEQYQWSALIGICAILPAIDHHRGWTHSWWALFVVPLPIIIIPVFFFHYSLIALLPYYASALIGYLSHLLVDWNW